jgi:hypothetical protein
MAYAEQGRFPQAVETAQRAVQLAREQNQTAVADALEARIEMYQSGKPYRDDLQGSQ